MKLSRLLSKILLPAFLQRLLGIPRSSLYGEAHWMGWFERRRFLARRHTGLVLSPRCRLSAQESFKNGSSGSPVEASTFCGQVPAGTATCSGED
jgi:hypothetical protein